MKFFIVVLFITAVAFAEESQDEVPAERDLPCLEKKIGNLLKDFKFVDRVANCISAPDGFTQDQINTLNESLASAATQHAALAEMDEVAKANATNALADHIAQIKDDFVSLEAYIGMSNPSTSEIKCTEKPYGRGIAKLENALDCPKKE